MSVSQDVDIPSRPAKIRLKPNAIEAPWPIMKLTKRLTAQVKRMRAAGLQSPKQTSDESYAQLDRFLRGSDTERNGERAKTGVKKQD